jgi:DNA-binding response OmpR family regulator
MLLDALAPAWEDFKKRVMTNPRILVVDDEPAVCTILSELLSMNGFNVDTTPTAEEAWERIQKTRYDLLLTDKNLPGESGLELIDRVRGASIALPAILITGYPSAETVADVLGRGALDYLTKPFELNHVLARVRAVLDRRMNGLLFDRIVADLAQAVKSAGAVREATLAALEEELSTFRVVLGSGPKVLLLDDAASSAPEIQHALEDAQLFTVVEDAASALRWVAEPGGPLVVAFSLARHGAIELVRTLRRADPQLEILVVMDEPDLARSLSAMSAGASDFVLLRPDGASMLTTRVRRLLARGRRTRLYLHLLASLYREARRVDHALAERVVSMVSADHQRYIRSAPELRQRLDLSSLAEGPHIVGDPLGQRPLVEEGS